MRRPKRTALESVCNDLVRRRLLGQYAPTDVVEARLADAEGLWTRLSLAVHGEVRSDDDVRSWLKHKDLGWAVPLVFALNKGAHGEALGSLTDMRADTSRLGRRLRELLG